MNVTLFSKRPIIEADSEGVHWWECVSAINDICSLPQCGGGCCEILALVSKAEAAKRVKVTHSP